MIMFRRCLRLLGLALSLSLVSAAARAEFPDRPIHLIVPYPPGGLVDAMARTIQEPLSAALGQTVIVDNRAGAAGAIATRAVAQSAPDGYSLIFSNNGPGALVPLIQKDAGYDPIGDFAPISLVATAPMVLVIHASVPATDLGSFIDFARGQSQGIEYASAGIGSLGHLTTELFAQKAGLKLVHVPYKGSAPAVMAVLGGEVKMYLSTTSDALDAGIKAGKVRLLGISTAAPSALMPGAAPIAGILPGFDVTVWFGLLAARGTPVEIVARLNAALREVLGRPDIQQRFNGYGCSASASSPEELAALIAQEVPKWRTTIDAAGIRL
jgi:tripartite-type tricarboxylate transporter receptor subunit TctC